MSRSTSPRPLNGISFSVIQIQESISADNTVTLAAVHLLLIGSLHDARDLFIGRNTTRYVFRNKSSDKGASTSKIFLNDCLEITVMMTSANLKKIHRLIRRKLKMLFDCNLFKCFCWLTIYWLYFCFCWIFDRIRSCL